MALFIDLFIRFFKIGIFTFGGGYASLPLIQQEIIDKAQWLTTGEFSDVITISQMTPGPIAINAATFVGTKVAGVPGAIVATAGVVTPSVLIVLGLSILYYKYKDLSVVKRLLLALRPAIAAFIAASGVLIVKQAMMPEQSMDIVAVIGTLIGLVLLHKQKITPIQLMLVMGAMGLVVYGFIA